jgi:hypothetical protein
MGSILSIRQDRPARSIAEDKRAKDSGSVAQGQALAEGVIKYAKGENETLRNFLRRIYDLTREGRTAFRAVLDDTLTAMRGNVKSLGDTDEAKRQSRSAGVRISEMRAFAKACDAGFPYPDYAHEGYHAVLGIARTFSDSSAANGPSVKRGRPAKTWDEKLAKYCADSLNFTTAEQYEEAAVLLRKLAKQVQAA